MTVGGMSKVAKDIRTRRSVRGARGHLTNATMPESIDGYWSKQWSSDTKIDEESKL